MNYQIVNMTQGYIPTYLSTCLPTYLPTYLPSSFNVPMFANVEIVALSIDLRQS